ncbi:MAG: hypothetical protein ACYDCQ_01795 [Dehalococcoidia bacterium]
MIVLRVLVCLAGVAIIGATLLSAVRTFVLPRAAVTRITRTVFVCWRSFFNLIAGPGRDYEFRDRMLAMYAPLSLLTIPFIWIVLVALAYTAIFWGLDIGNLREAAIVSGSSLFTLGFSRPDGFPAQLISFTESMLGPGLVALLVSYLPSIYAAFARRETAVTVLESYAGSPPSPREMLLRYRRIGGLDRLNEFWPTWQEWFADVEESHSSIAALCFFRSPQPDRSWITAAGCVLDTASLYMACIDVPDKVRAALCIRTGFLALRHIADYFGIAYDADPAPDAPISIDRSEFDEVWDTLAAGGLPLMPDRDVAWRGYNGWRVNYDTTLVALAGLVVAPYAPWSSDRSAPYRRPRLFGKLRRKQQPRD